MLPLLDGQILKGKWIGGGINQYICSLLPHSSLHVRFKAPPFGQKSDGKKISRSQIGVCTKVEVTKLIPPLQFPSP